MRLVCRILVSIFSAKGYSFLKQYDTKIIVNVCGHAPEEYLAVVERLADQPIDMMEINISCPNVNVQDSLHLVRMHIM